MDHSTTDPSHAHKTQTQGPSSYVERRVKDPIQCNPLVHGVRNLVLFSGRLPWDGCFASFPARSSRRRLLVTDLLKKGMNKLGFDL